MKSNLNFAIALCSLVSTTAAADASLNSARLACRDIVRASLHDPISARFEPTDTYQVARGDDGVYRVQVRVRARNAFNALRLETIECHIRRERGKWIGAAPPPLAFPTAEDLRVQRDREMRAAESARSLKDAQDAARARLDRHMKERYPDHPPLAQ